MFKISSIRITPAEIKKSVERYLQKDKNIIELLTGGIIFPLVINLRPVKRKATFLNIIKKSMNLLKIGKMVTVYLKIILG